MISAKILADSVNEQGNRLTTFEIEVPRMVWAEFVTHGMICRNAASSRAIPFAKMQEQLTARPVRFGQANPGMQDKGVEFDAKVNYTDADFGYSVLNTVSPEMAWEEAKERAVCMSRAFYEAGYHKQVYNRITEPFQIIKAVASATELDNFFWLRKHGAADPTLEALAQSMWDAREASKPVLLKPGQYHLPYVYSEIDENGRQEFFIEQDVEGWGEARYIISLEQAIKVSAARCAAVSFRKEDYGLEKCLEVYEKLVGDERKHASAFQHQASPLIDNELKSGSVIVAEHNDPMFPKTWQEGVSHVDRDGNLWSAQFKGFIMYRKLIKGENYSLDTQQQPA